jgi:hypothetical protein
MDRWIDGWIERWMDGTTDGWKMVEREMHGQAVDDP